MTPVTATGRRLLQMLVTEKGPRGYIWPKAFDARLVERIVEDYIPQVEAEAREKAGPNIKMGGRVFIEWGDTVSWGKVVGVGGTSKEPTEYTITVQREGGSDD